jgi:hypothetical protein
MRNIALLFCLVVAVARASAADRVTVQQLEQKVHSIDGESDKDVAQMLSSLVLTERLSAVRANEFEQKLPGEKSRLAFVALADTSAFLELPASEIPQNPPPDRATQGRMLSLAVDFVTRSTSKMPDFLAKRTTMRFQDSNASRLNSMPEIFTPQNFHLLDRSSVVVQYRNGKEEEENLPAKDTGMRSSTAGLMPWGIFGPLLGEVMRGILQAKVGWSHWERGSSDLVAVFRFSVPKEQSSYIVKYCCIPDSHESAREFQINPQYHGEITIEPTTGSVLRLVVKSDLPQTAPIFRADVMVEYGPVRIGGRSYVLPRKSAATSVVSATVARGGIEFNALTSSIPSPTSAQVDSGFRSPNSKQVDEFKVTAINDVVFDDYHVFSAEMRIVPEQEQAIPKN